MATSSVEVPTRPFGRTGIPVSILALGGWHVGLPKTEREATRLIHAAIDSGITFMDNAWDYNEGVSETRMGKALADRRDKVFLMTKVCTHGRDARTAMKQLEDSLRRLKTDYLDLWQLHEVIFDDEPAKYFAKGGAVEALDKARQQGKVRFVGFTGHKDPELHLQMLAHDYPWDSCQLPLNCFDASFRSFEQRVLPELNRRGIAPIGMKSLGGDARCYEEEGRDAAGSHPLHVEPADRHAGQRHRHDARAAPEPRHRAGVPSDVGPPASGAVAARAAPSRATAASRCTRFPRRSTATSHAVSTVCR